MEIVKQYASIFDPPTKLPPERPEDIKINLTEGALPPKIRSMPRTNDQENKLFKETLIRL